MNPFLLVGPGVVIGGWSFLLGVLLERRRRSRYVVTARWNPLREGVECPVCHDAPVRIWDGQRECARSHRWHMEYRHPVVTKCR